jgi:hypothetical protein
MANANNNMWRPAFFVATILSVVLAACSAYWVSTKVDEQAHCGENGDSKRLKWIAQLFPETMTRETLSYLLRARVPGALIPESEMNVEFRGLSFEFDDFGTLMRIRPADAPPANPVR